MPFGLICVPLTGRVDVCVVYAIVALIASVDWLFRGRKKFVVAGERKEEGVNPAPRIVDLPGY
jgi:choline transport protein